MSDERRLRRTLALGAVIAALGLIGVAGGIVLLIWRLINPNEAVILPPGSEHTPEPTPTPGILGTPLPPPPPIENAPIVILPVSEHPTRTPTAAPSPAYEQSEQATTEAGALFTVPGRGGSQTRPSKTIFDEIPHQAASFTPTLYLLPELTLAPLPTAIPTLTPTAIPTIPDWIRIEAIGLDAPVFPVSQRALTLGGQVYSQWIVPNERAAGWHANSAPLGQPGNTVLNGHHNVYGEVFHYLVALQPGDLITLEAQGKPHVYMVVQTMTLAEEGQPVETRLANARWILPTEDERVTLITCWPYDSNTHRLVVIALPLAAVGDSGEIP
jgi:sortase A